MTLTIYVCILYVLDAYKNFQVYHIEYKIHWLYVIYSVSNNVWVNIWVLSGRMTVTNVRHSYKTTSQTKSLILAIRLKCAHKQSGNVVLTNTDDAKTGKWCLW